MPNLKKHWQNHASSTELLDYFGCGVAKYVIPIVLSPLAYNTITNPIGMEIMYGISTTDITSTWLASHLAHSFFRATHKRKASDKAQAHALSTPWNRKPIKKSSLLRAFIQDVVSLPKPITEYKEQKFAYKYDGHINKLRREANKQYEEKIKPKTAPMPRPK